MILLNEYKGKVIQAKCIKGLIVFDTNRVQESEYQLYHRLGFDFCFEAQPLTNREPKRYKGIEQNKKITEVNPKKNGKKAKAKTEEK